MRKLGLAIGGATVALVPIALAAGLEWKAKVRDDQFRRLAMPLAAMSATFGERAESGGGARVTLNGLPCFVKSETKAGTVSSVLDAASGDCASTDPHVALGVSRESSGELAGEQAIHLVDTKRSGDDRSGISVCLFEREDARNRVSGVGAGDTVGRLRSTFAARGEDGQIHVTTISVLAEGSLDAIFPNEGDARGSDPLDAPRPAASRRLLTATIEGTPRVVRVYETASPIESAVRSYDANMDLAGWSSSTRVAHELPDGRYYWRGDRELVATFARGESGTNIALSDEPLDANASASLSE